MGGVDERRARNEAVFRETNERLEALGQERGDGTLELVCECSDPFCSLSIAIPVAAYEAARDDARRFLVAPGHERADLERIIERHADYTVVEKSGEAGEIAEETDPRPDE